MFLTTNRITNFDTAFKSRIHLAIKYPSLSPASQRQLWRMFITNDSQHPEPHWLTPTMLDDLGSRGLNGRQIRNVVRIAMTWAAATGRELEPQDINTSLKTMEDFERDFEGAIQKSRAPDDRRDTNGYERSLESGGGHKRKRLE